MVSSMPIPATAAAVARVTLRHPDAADVLRVGRVIREIVISYDVSRIRGETLSERAFLPLFLSPHLFLFLSRRILRKYPGRGRFM